MSAGRIKEIEIARVSTKTVMELTGVFEGIASMRIARIKNQVAQATEFFNDIWNIYNQLRVDSMFRFGRDETDEVINKELYIVITGETSFSGDIDQKLTEWMISNYDPEKNDVVVLGHHGAVQLAQKGVSFVKYFKLPSKDQNINVAPIIKIIQKYENTTVYYQQYVSLMVQDVRRIQLSKAVAEQGAVAAEGEDVISEENYIFEPSTYAVIGYLERSMLQVTLCQLILDSKLAQYASRFRAMSSANQLAEDQFKDLTLKLNRSKRAIKDQRLKETINGLRLMRKED